MIKKTWYKYTFFSLIQQKYFLGNTKRYPNLEDISKKICTHFFCPQNTRTNVIQMDKQTNSSNGYNEENRGD